MNRGILMGIVMAVAFTWAPPPARATCASDVASTNVFEVSVGCSTGGGNSQPDDHQPEPEFSAYKFEPLCTSETSSPASATNSCLLIYNCGPSKIPGMLLGLKGAEWTKLGVQCRSASSSPTLTPATLSTAFARIPLPHLRSTAQPGTRTLVNLDTIFHTDATPLTRHLTLLGQHVELRITPTHYTWTFGDGTTQTTTTPGAPYPSHQITHRYHHAHLTVLHHVTTTWTARWRLPDTPWNPVPGTVTTTGPDTPLQIAEATPLLTGTS